MGYKSPAIHRKCYSVDCGCKNSRYEASREAVAHCNACDKAKEVYYDSAYDAPRLVYSKAGGFA